MLNVLYNYIILKECHWRHKVAQQRIKTVKTSKTSNTQRANWLQFSIG